MARHKEFDPDAALDRAMALFWEQGYEKTSMQELVERMGVHKRSMYDTFGDKRSLYLKALDRYGEKVERLRRATADGAADPRAAIRALLTQAVARADAYPSGCLAVNCATETAPRDPDAARWVERIFAGEHALLLELVRRGQRDGEITSRLDARTLADLLLNAWVGLRVQVRVGASAERLTSMIDSALALLD
ncbi:TetR/AcrR family transcriptional regulator [Micromonospora sp. NPDC049559]|uniref:TetR/AcrR family transcriptional regulator n=1 Tax=Micromonospora sp. NPDC049559 TaxID=3155923 RepID=UPI0034386A05